MNPTEYLIQSDGGNGPMMSGNRRKRMVLIPATRKRRQIRRNTK